MLRKLLAGSIVVSLVAALALALAPQAGASGVTTHSWMATDAIALVDDPQLRALLEAHVDQVSAGAHFPDSGYANSAADPPIDTTYGEEAHWPRFSYAYLDQIRDDPDCGDLTDPDGPCAARIAHVLTALLGAALLPAQDLEPATLELDLQMLVMLGGQERTEAEYRALFAAAGLRLSAVVPLGDAGQFSVLEGVPA